MWEILETDGISYVGIKMSKENDIEMCQSDLKENSSMRDTYIVDTGDKMKKILHPVEEDVKQDFEQTGRAYIKHKSSLNNDTIVDIKEEILSDEEEDDPLGRFDDACVSIKMDDVKSVENGIKEEVKQMKFDFVDVCTKTEIKIEASENDTMNDDFSGRDSPRKYMLKQNMDKIGATVSNDSDAFVSIDQQNHTTKISGSDSHSNELRCVYKGVNVKMIRNNGRWLYQCTFCSKVFQYFRPLEIHTRTHTGERPFVCKLCQKGFSEPYRLQVHTRMHTGEQPYKCQKCPKVYQRLRSLEVHMRTHTGERPFVCKYCEKGFTELQRLKEHTRVHTGERPYKCQECDKTFKTDSAMRIHTKIHAEERPHYQCVHCFRTYSSKQHLQRHIGVHINPFKCELCEKTFGDNYFLQRHFKTHTGECSFKCEQCDKGFKTNHELKLHIRVHTGERPYKCKKCHKCFSNCSNLSRHVRVRGHE